MTRSPSPLSGEGSLRGPHTPTQPAASEQSHNPAQNFSPRLGRDPHTPTSRSPSQSRAASPLRRLGWALHRVHAREEPFVPVDPFRIGFFGPASKGDRVSVMQRPDSDNDIECKDAFGGCLPLPVLSPCKTKDGESEGGSWKDVFRDARTFLTDTLPRQLYLILLLGLPALYWSRVTRVFEDAELSRPDVQRMIDACTRDPNDRGPEGVPGTRDRSVPSRHTVLLPFPEEWNPPMVSPALVRFKHSWEQFVDSLLREWKTLNLVSALLCTAILTMFQVDDAEDDPVTRSAALFGLVFALMSLCYGCVFIVQFGTMRTMDRASRWAEEAQRTKTAILWNIWVLLAAPAIWLAWSMIAFCVSILSYVWRTGSIANQTPPSPLSTRQAIGVRTAITVVFALGLFKFAMIIRTFSSYHGARRERRRMREEMLGGKVRDERERGRRDAMEEVRERESRAGSASVVGLGLTGLSEHALASPGMASLTGVVRDEGDPEKADFLSIEKGRGRLRISPKL
ncbi:predicted protein [Postia placenta Mad-698-R]|nr:predicted protein [Postia placenta Mad-698-R]